MTGILQGLIGSYLGRNQVNLVISANTSAYDVYTNRGPAYVAGSDITVTVNPGVTVGSQNTAGYALLVPSQFSPTDNITIVNQGSIVGSGGNGGAGGSAYFAPLSPASQNVAIAATSGTGGGNAVYVNRPVTITNNGTIASGGGGGGGGAVGFIWSPTTPVLQARRAGGGGGGGGGAGYSVAGTGGSATPVQRSSPTLPGLYVDGQPGSNGTSTTGGSGGIAGSQTAPPLTYGFIYGGDGGAGGSLGAGGGTGGTGYYTPGPPGTVPGGKIFPPGAAGGSTGFYIVGNPFVTWAVNGTRQGNVG